MDGCVPDDTAALSAIIADPIQAQYLGGFAWPERSVYVLRLSRGHGPGVMGQMGCSSVKASQPTEDADVEIHPTSRLVLAGGAG